MCVYSYVTSKKAQHKMSKLARAAASETAGREPGLKDRPATQLGGRAVPGVTVTKCTRSWLHRSGLLRRQQQTDKWAAVWTLWKLKGSHLNS